MELVVAIARAEKAKKEARDVATALSNVSITIAQKAGEDGRLFGSVTVKDIEAALAARGTKVDRRAVHLTEPIRTVGTHEVVIKLASDVTATVKVDVVAK